jgi:hypothetical protein
MSCRTISRFLLVCSILLCAAVAMAQVAPTTLFQLDGNAASTPLNTCVYGASTGQLCDYWNLLNGTGSPVDANGFGAGSSAGHSLTRTYIDGTVITNVFSQGSKDTNDTTTWVWSGSGSPNKDTFLAGYAAAYQQSGDLVLTFGANRLSANGDANVGIWFFQNDVEKQSNNTFGPGAHKDGDVFIVSQFTNGGGTAPVTAYAWDAALCSKIKTTVKNPTVGGCADTNLVFLGSSAATSVCGTSIFCAITNATTTTSTWNGDLITPLFFEGGVDITAAFKAAKLATPGCFSSFLEETRASQSTGAELKDFLGGSFTLCKVSISKQCTGAKISDPNGTTTYGFSGNVTNKGVGALYNIVVTDTYPANATNTKLTQPVLPDTCINGNTTVPCLLPLDTASYSGSFDLPSTNNSAVNEAKVDASATSGGPVAVSDGPNPWPLQQTGANKGEIAGPNGDGDNACIATPTAGLVVSKTCTTSVTGGSSLSVTVTIGGTVSNPSTSNVDVTGVTLCDAEGSVTCPSPAGSNQIDPITWPTATAGLLRPGDSITYSGKYTPTSFTCGGTGVCSFTDTVFASGTGADGLGTEAGSAGATCHLCPNGACSSGN